MKTIGFIGAGSWGTALAIIQAAKGHAVRIWDRDEDHLASMEKDRENVKYLPGCHFPDNLTIVPDVESAVKGADIVVFAVPAQPFRGALKGTLPFLKESQITVNVAKGIEQGTLKRMSEVADELAPGLPYVVLSGPSHAEEVGKYMPTTVAVGSRDASAARFIQDEFMTDRFRIYTVDDIVGMELGGSLKNIIALGAGISDGMGFGDNAKAALMTRGLAEIRRLGEKLGAKPSTFLGLTGVGDLIVTCTSMHSRNRRCGIMIGEGVPPEEAIKRVGMYTARAAKELAEREGVDMPITQCINDVIDGRIDAADSVDLLMGRDKKQEAD